MTGWPSASPLTCMISIISHSKLWQRGILLMQIRSYYFLSFYHNSGSRNSSPRRLFLHICRESSNTCFLPGVPPCCDILDQINQFEVLELTYLFLIDCNSSIVISWFLKSRFSRQSTSPVFSHGCNRFRAVKKDWKSTAWIRPILFLFFSIYP